MKNNRYLFVVIYYSWFLHMMQSSHPDNGAKKFKDNINNFNFFKQDSAFITPEAILCSYLFHYIAHKKYSLSSTPYSIQFF